MSRLARAWRGALIAVGVVAFCSADALAFPTYGTTVDNYCTTNQRQPAAPFSNDCAICHNPSNAGSNRTPLFGAFKSGDLDAFCPPTANAPPQFDAIADVSVNEDALLSLQVVATDPDRDALTMEAANLPTGAAFQDLGNGVAQLVWMPSFDQAGSHLVTFKATDDGSPAESAMAIVTITVGNVNRRPSLGTIGNRSVAAGALLSIPLMATDPDGNGIQYGSAGLPAEASLLDYGDGTGLFEWSPTAADAGTHPMTISVTDDGVPMASDAKEFAVTVGIAGTNLPPQLDPIGDRISAEGQPWSVGLGANDPDGGALAFDCSGAPTGALLDDAGDGTGSLRGVAGFDQAGNYAVTCAVTDSGIPPESDAETFTLTIGDVNRPPTLDPVSVIRDGDWMFVPLMAHDPDGNAVAFSVVGMPVGANLVDHGDGTAEFSFLPPAGLTGALDLVFTVTDDGVPSETASRKLTISLGDAKPALSLLKARWNRKRRSLEVSGSGAPSRATVEILDAATGNVLMSLEARRRGRFGGQRSLDAGPCAVRADAGGETSSDLVVTPAPAGCTVGTPDRDDDRRDRDSEERRDDDDDDDRKGDVDRVRRTDAHHRDRD